MSERKVGTQSPEERANDRYWHSDLGVNQIIEELGLSKSRLYESILPLPAGGECPDCGRALVYPNRTARDRDQPVCPDGCTERRAEAGGAGPAWGLDRRAVLSGLAIGGTICFLVFRLVRR